MSKINCSMIISRGILTSSVQYGKKNFDKFLLTNKRGTKLFKKKQAKNPDPDIPIDKRGVRVIGFYKDKLFTKIHEMIPELIVPNLNNFHLKPYVSYKSENVYQSKFTSKDLFDVVYKAKIIEDFQKGKLNITGQPLEPSQEENLTPEKARQLASKSGSDIFTSPALPFRVVIPTDQK